MLREGSQRNSREETERRCGDRGYRNASGPRHSTIEQNTQNEEAGVRTLDTIVSPGRWLKADITVFTCTHYFLPLSVYHIHCTTELLERKLPNTSGNTHATVPFGSSRTTRFDANGDVANSRSRTGAIRTPFNLCDDAPILTAISESRAYNATVFNPR